MTPPPPSLLRTLAVLPLWFATVALAAPEALAAPPEALDYRAPAGCPDMDGFVLAVEARGASFAAPAAPAAAAPSQPRRLLVRIEPEGSGFAGSLVVQSGAESSEPRRVQGESCAEVSDALAVVTAIALQRDAEMAPAAAPPAAATQPEPDPVLAEPSAAQSLVPELVMARRDVVVPAGRLVLDHLSTHTLSAGVQLGAIPGVALPRLDFNISRTNVVTTPDSRAFVLGNEFRVRWTLYMPVKHQARGYETSLLGLKAGIGGCTPLTYNPTGLILKACSEIMAGLMDLTTRSADGTFEREKSLGLATVGVEAEAQYNLSSLFHLSLRAGGELWLSRISAEREDGSRLFQSPLFNAHVMVGVGIHF